MTPRSIPTTEIPSVRALLERGRQRRYVTYDEVDRALPADSVTPDRLDALVSALAEETIELRAGAPNVAPTRSSVGAEDAYLGRLAAAPPLLTREGEVELGRRFERADRAIREAILCSGLVLDELTETVRRLEQREVRLDAVTLRYSASGEPSTDQDEGDPGESADGGREARRAELEVELRAAERGEKRYLRGLVRGAVSARARAARRGRLEALQLTPEFWDEVATRVQHTSRRLRERDIPTRGLRGRVGLSAEDVHSLARQVARARRARDRAKADLVESNLRLVVSFARRMPTTAMALSDLIQEGNIGLMRATEKFDYRRGYRFSTYASWWIRQSVQRALADQSRTIRVPVHMNECIQRVTRSERKLLRLLGRPPSEAEIQEETGLSETKIRAARAAALRMVSLDAPVGDDGDRRVSDLLEDERVLPADDASDQRRHSAQAEELLQLLTPREQKVLRMRFGVGWKQDHTLREIGEDLQVSRERVRQIEGSALEKLRSLARRSPANQTESRRRRKIS